MGVREGGLGLMGREGRGLGLGEGGGVNREEREGVIMGMGVRGGTSLHSHVFAMSSTCVRLLSKLKI